MPGRCPNHGPYDENACPFPPPHGYEQRNIFPVNSSLPKVFLCHASPDKPLVRKLYRDLISDGVEAWLDAENLMPGQNWQMEIPKAIRNSNVVIVCLSENSINKEGFVQKEIKFALDIADEKPEGTIFVIPALLTVCKIPENLNKWQGVNLFEDDGYRRLLNSLRLNTKILEANLQITNAVKPSGFCPEHGPFDGSFCPYPHEVNNRFSERPVEIYDDGEEPTDLGSSRQDSYTEVEDTENTPRGVQKNLCLLWTASGRYRGRTYSIRDGMTIGRGDGDLIIDDRKASRIHAKFQLKVNKFYIWDLGSSNGTYLNNKKIRDLTLINENDLLRIGDSIFVVKILLPLYKQKIANNKKPSIQKNNAKSSSKKIKSSSKKTKR